MPFIAPDNWRPVGIDDLEPTAWKALQHPGSTCVVAGPGAGKTEFLAQRAAYLLQTGLCPPPFRILAISFKRDAAENLAARVRKRCTNDQAARFVSLTFDSFTKGLVDRFLSAVPELWQPSRPYSVVFPKKKDVDAFLQLALYSVSHAWQPDIIGLSGSDFEARHVGAWRLPLHPTEPISGVDYTIQQWWNERLGKPHQSTLTFILINRLAELLQRANLHIGRSLRTTYPFVFVDEFQDTTYAQYDFLLSAFSGGEVVLTAVGDDKQRIMSWAGARSDAFTQFRTDFSAQRFPLCFNFRSSPDLVRIQHVVARALDDNATEAEAQTECTIDGEAAQVWVFTHEATEAVQIATWLSDDMARRNTAPRDHALLVRQTADRFETQLGPAFAAANLALRNESRAIGKTTLQDLLVEGLTQISLAILRVATCLRAPESWSVASEAVLRLRGVDPEDEVAGRRAEDALIVFIEALRADLACLNPTPDHALNIAEHLFAFLDPIALARAFVEYNVGDNLAIAMEAFTLHLAASAKGADNWACVLDVFEGVESTPLMTVHKSKGLEYDTILFVGLDDKMWWSHSPGDPEGVATFFVALSRARQRAIFTFCSERGQRIGVNDLYQLLSDAGVREINYASE